MLCRLVSECTRCVSLFLLNGLMFLVRLRWLRARVLDLVGWCMQLFLNCKVSIRHQLNLYNLIAMSSRMMLPIELTKILYQTWEGQISTSSQDSEIYGKCLNGPGKVVFKNGNRYQGNFYNGLLNGQGKFIWANGIVYEGQFTDNRITGKGIYRWPDGSNYEGQVKDGLRHGHGKYSIDDATYEGQWFQGKKSGKGKIEFKSGSIFQGNFKNDMKDGYGKMYYYPSGNYFEGDWKEDMKCGMGTMNWTDIRQKYVGKWANNQQQGWGVHIWLESRGQGKYLRNRYEGNWKAGVRQGFGVFYYANGSRYEGYWVNNMKEGYSFYTDENGKTSLILFRKDRMMKGEKPSQIQNQNVKKVSNKKEVQPNLYALCLSIDHFYLPTTPNLQHLYNFLLRNNTQLKTWYKGASLFYDQQSEYSFSLNLQGTWKMIRSLKVLGQFSLAQFNRGLSQSKPDIQALLKIVPQLNDDRVSYQDIYYRYLGSLKEGQDINLADFPFRSQVVHDRQTNILLRQFVHILVWMAHNLDANYDKPHKSIQKLIKKISPFLETITTSQKSSTGSQHMSQNKSSISKAQKNLSPFYKGINSQIFKALLPRRQGLRRLKDDTVRIRQLIAYGRINGCIGQAQWGLLQKILQKYFDNDILNRQNTQWKDSQIPSKILNVMNYQLIEYEFIQIVYILFIKKLPSTKQNQQNKRKYQEVVEEIFKARKQHQIVKQKEQEFSQQVRYVQSDKAKVREALRQKRRVLEAAKAQRQAEQRERQRQERQRQLLAHEDIDIKDLQFEQQESEFQI